MYQRLQVVRRTRLCCACCGRLAKKCVPNLSLSSLHSHGQDAEPAVHWHARLAFTGPPPQHKRPHARQLGARETAVPSFPYTPGVHILSTMCQQYILYTIFQEQGTKCRQRVDTSACDVFLRTSVGILRTSVGISQEHVTRRLRKPFARSGAWAACSHASQRSL